MKRAATFSEVDYSPLGDGVHYRLLRPLIYTDAMGRRTVIPADFVSDLASVPDCARIGLILLLLGVWFHWRWVFVGGVVIVWLARQIDNRAKTDREAILHDWRFWNGGGCAAFFRANWELYHAMRLRNPWLLCAVYWFNLTLFGCFAWWSNAKKRRALAALDKEAHDHFD